MGKKQKRVKNGIKEEEKRILHRTIHIDLEDILAIPTEEPLGDFFGIDRMLLLIRNEHEVREMERTNLSTFKEQAEGKEKMLSVQEEAGKKIRFLIDTNLVQDRTLFRGIGRLVEQGYFGSNAL